MKEGARYTWSLKPLRYLLPMLALMSFTIMPYHALMPIFAAEIFSGGASMLGFLVGAAGFGGIIGMMFLAARPQIRGLMRWAAIGPGLSGIALTAFTFSRNLAFSLACMAVVGFGVAMQSFDPFDNIAIQILFWGLLGIGIGTVVRLGDRPSDYRIALKLGH